VRVLIDCLGSGLISILGLKIKKFDKKKRFSARNRRQMSDLALKIAEQSNNNCRFSLASIKEFIALLND